MARRENPPFGRGETYYGTSPIPAIDANNLGGKNFEGEVWEFEDISYALGAVGAKQARSNRLVKCMCVRNISGIALLPKRLANLTTVAEAEVGQNLPAYLGQVDGYATATAQRAYPIDEWLPAAGVAANDLFWIVIEGPATVLTAQDGGADNVFTIGLGVVALTAVTSQATTAGRVAPVDFTGATVLLGNQIKNMIGWALSAATTANTAAGLLIEVGKW
jgi:hypothetical protein